MEITEIKETTEIMEKIQQARRQTRSESYHTHIHPHNNREDDDNNNNNNNNNNNKMHGITTPKTAKYPNKFSPTG